MERNLIDYRLDIGACRYVIVRVYMGNWTVVGTTVEAFNARQMWKAFGMADCLIWDNELTVIADSVMRD